MHRNKTPAQATILTEQDLALKTPGTTPDDRALRGVRHQNSLFQALNCKFYVFPLRDFTVRYLCNAVKVQ